MTDSQTCSLLGSRKLLALLQERLDPHRDAEAWGEVCALLAAPTDATINLDAENWKAIKQAIGESTWIPPQYTMNEIVIDVCGFLRSRPAERPVGRWHNGNPEHTLSHEIAIGHPVNEDDKPTRYLINVEQLGRIQAMENLLSAAQQKTLVGSEAVAATRHDEAVCIPGTQPSSPGTKAAQTDNVAKAAPHE